MLMIMTSNPMVTMMSSTKPNQPRTMAEVPTPDLTLPFPRSCAIVDAATEAVCCHSTETSTKIDEVKMRARATCETGREGKGLDVDVGSGALVSLLVPAGEGGEEDEGEEGEDDGDDEQVGEDDGILEGGSNPHEVEGILVDGQIVDERGCVVGADVAAAVPVDADAEVADAHAELCVADDVGD